MRKFRSKVEVLRIVLDCAALFEKNLSHKHILFVTNSNDNAAGFESLFMPHNFKHLTGAGRKDIDSVVFYNRAIEKRLGVEDIVIDKRGFTDLKLDVLPKLMSIHNTARMVGDFDGLSEKIVADKFAGTTVSAMGFELSDNIYIPKTALKESVSNVTKKASRSRVIAIFMKEKDADKYKHITYKAHNVELKQISEIESLKDMLEFEKLVIPDSWTS